MWAFDSLVMPGNDERYQLSILRDGNGKDGQKRQAKNIETTVIDKRSTST
jgi:hypothetical protein